MKYVASPLYRCMVLALVFIVCSAVTGHGKAADYDSMSKTELQSAVAALGLGLDSYVIGKTLTEEQQKIAKQDGGYKAYPGTIKFKDDGVFVIADEKNSVVIAVYRRNKKATEADFKATVGDLMLQHGEPTAEAHGKIIYWNFGSDGLVPEELYRTAKAEGMLDTLSILATVKFSSSESVDSMSDMIEKMEKDGKIEKSGEEKLSDNYVMVQSDFLTKKYLNK